MMMCAYVILIDNFNEYLNQNVDEMICILYVFDETYINECRNSNIFEDLLM